MSFSSVPVRGRGENFGNEWVNSLRDAGVLLEASASTGPASSTDNAVPRFNGTTGKVVQNSGVIIDDSDNATGLAGVSMNGNLRNAAWVASKILGTNGTKDATSLTAAEATALINEFVGDAGSGGTKGLVKAPTTGDATKYLRGNGTWDTPTAGTGALSITAVKTSTYTAAANELVRCNASGGAFTVNFTTAVGIAGSRIGVLKIKADTSFNKITMDGGGSETLNDALTRKVCTSGEYFEWTSDGANWVRTVHTFSTDMMDLGVVAISAVTTPPTKSAAMLTDKVRGSRLPGGFLRLKFDLSHSTASVGGGSGEYYWWPTTSPGTVDTTKQPEFTVAAGNIGGTSPNTLQKALIGQGHHGITSSSSNHVYAYLIDSTKITVTAGPTAIGSASNGWANANWGICFEVIVPMTDWE